MRSSSEVPAARSMAWARSSLWDTSSTRWANVPISAPVNPASASRSRRRLRLNHLYGHSRYVSICEADRSGRESSTDTPSGGAMTPARRLGSMAPGAAGRSLASVAGRSPEAERFAPTRVSERPRTFFSPSTRARSEAPAEASRP